MTANDSRRTYQVDDEFLNNLANVTEALANLLYLIRVDAENVDAVRMYVTQSDERVAALVALLRSVSSE